MSLKAAVIGGVRMIWAPVVLVCALILLYGQSQDLAAAFGGDVVAGYRVEQGGLVLIWLAGAWLFNRLIILIFWQGIVRHILGRTPPRLIIQLGGLLVFLLALSGIMRFVFNESVTAIWAASGALGIVIGFALRNLILDTFSGLAIHLERPFKVGDWINCHTRMGDYIGRVEETNWRTTRLWTTSRNMVIIPNSYLTTTVMTNYSMPETAARFEMDFVLDFSVPSDRGLRILTAALVSAIGTKGPLADPAPKVRVNGIADYGVQYRLRYYLEPAEVSPNKARHTITQAVLHHIRQAGITLSYPRRDLFLAKMPWRHKGWSYLKDQIHHLSNLSIFQGLEEADLEFLAHNMTLHSFDRASMVMKQGDAGDSMFILAEGLLEVLLEQENREQVKVANLAPGTFFGEKSLLTGDVRSATIVCVSESTVCEITKETLAQLFDHKPELVETLGRAVIERDMQNEIALSKLSKEAADAKVSSVVSQFVSKIKLFFREG